MDSKLMSRMSKKSLYKLLKTKFRFSLPKEYCCPLKFMQQILSGEKKVMMQKGFSKVDMPMSTEFSVKHIWPKIKDNQQIRMYLPDLKKPEKNMDRDFLWRVMFMVDEAAVEGYLNRVLNLKNKARGRGSERLQILPELLNQYSELGQLSKIIMTVKKDPKPRRRPEVIDVSLEIGSNIRRVIDPPNPESESQIIEPSLANLEDPANPEELNLIDAKSEIQGRNLDLRKPINPRQSSEMSGAKILDIRQALQKRFLEEKQRVEREYRSNQDDEYDLEIQDQVADLPSTFRNEQQAANVSQNARMQNQENPDSQSVYSGLSRTSKKRTRAMFVDGQKQAGFQIPSHEQQESRIQQIKRLKREINNRKEVE